MSSIASWKFSERVRAVRFTPDGRCLLIAPESGEPIHIFEIDQGVVSSRVPIAWDAQRRGGRVLDVAVHPLESSVALAGSEMPLTVWSVPRAAQIGVLSDAGTTPRRRHAFPHAVFAPSGRHLEVASTDRGRGERYVWPTGLLAGTRWGSNGPIAYHPEGVLTAVVNVESEEYSQAGIGTWNDETFEWFTPILVAYMAVGCAAFSPDGAAFAMLGGLDVGHVQVHHFPSCDVIFEKTLAAFAEPFEFPFGMADALDFGRDGSTLFVGDGADVVEIETRTGREVRRVPGDVGTITSLRVHPSRAWLAAGGLHGHARLLQLAERHSDNVVAAPTQTNEFRRLFDVVPRGEIPSEDDGAVFEGPSH